MLRVRCLLLRHPAALQITGAPRDPRKKWKLRTWFGTHFFHGHSWLSLHDLLCSVPLLLLHILCSGFLWVSNACEAFLIIRLGCVPPPRWRGDGTVEIAVVNRPTFVVLVVPPKTYVLARGWFCGVRGGCIHRGGLHCVALAVGKGSSSRVHANSLCLAPPLRFQTV